MRDTHTRNHQCKHNNMHNCVCVPEGFWQLWATQRSGRWPQPRGELWNQNQAPRFEALACHLIALLPPVPATSAEWSHGLGSQHLQSIGYSPTQRCCVNPFTSKLDYWMHCTREHCSFLLETIRPCGSPGLNNRSQKIQLSTLVSSVSCEVKASDFMVWFP